MYIVTIYNHDTLEIMEAPYDTFEEARRVVNIVIFAAADNVEAVVKHNGEVVY